MYRMYRTMHSDSSVEKKVRKFIRDCIIIDKNSAKLKSFSTFFPKIVSNSKLFHFLILSESPPIGALNKYTNYFVSKKRLEALYQCYHISKKFFFSNLQVQIDSKTGVLFMLRVHSRVSALKIQKSLHSSSDLRLRLRFGSMALGTRFCNLYQCRCGRHFPILFLNFAVRV